MLQCTAGTLLRRRHSGSSYGKHVVRHSNLVLPCLIVPGTFSLLIWHGSHVHPETHKFLGLVTDGHLPGPV